MLATVDDVQAALGRELTLTEATQATVSLAEATDLVVGHIGYDPIDALTAGEVVPAAISRVVARMVARVLVQSAQAGSEGTTETVGPFSRTVRFGVGTTSGAPWLTAADKIALRPYRGGGGMRVVSLSSAQTGRYRRYT